MKNHTPAINTTTKVVIAIVSLYFHSSHISVSSGGNNRDIRIKTASQLENKAPSDSEIARLHHFLRHRCGDDKDIFQIQSLIDALDADPFSERENASARLVAVGQLAVHQLTHCAYGSNEEVAKRSKECLKLHKDRWDFESVFKVINKLKQQRSRELPELLLRILPFATEDVEFCIWRLLDEWTEGRSDILQECRKKINDRIPVRRAIASYLLGRRGTREDKNQARKALRDSNPEVRLRAAQGLLRCQDATAVPVLLTLLLTPNVEVAWQAEELLVWLAGDTAPKEVVATGKSDSLRRKCFLAWSAWWEAQKHKIDFEAPIKAKRVPGLVLAFEKNSATDGDPEAGCLWIGGCQGKPRWRLSGLDMVYDMVWLPGGRFLTAEGQYLSTVQGCRSVLYPNYPFGEKGGVSERMVDGTIVRKFVSITYPNRVSRLINGNTLIRTSSSLHEINPMDKRITNESFAKWGEDDSYFGGRSPIRLGATKVVVIATGLTTDYLLGILEKNPERVQKLIPLESTSSEGKKITVSGTKIDLNRMENGNFIILGWTDGKLRAIDMQGKTIWATDLREPIKDTYPNRMGGILVATENTIYEYNSHGKIIWSKQHDKDLRMIRPLLELVRIGYVIVN